VQCVADALLASMFVTRDAKMISAAKGEVSACFGPTRFASSESTGGE